MKKHKSPYNKSLKKSIAYFILSLAFLFIWGCKNTSNSLASENQIITFTKISKNYKEGKDCDLADSLVYNCAQLNISKLVPESSSKTLNESIVIKTDEVILNMVAECILEDRNEIQNQKTKSIDSLVQLYFKLHNDFLKEFEEGSGSWSIEIGVDLHAQTKNVVTLSVVGFTFLGGAHPNTNITYLNFDKNTGKLLNFNDFVTDQELFLSLADQEFRKNQEISNNQNLEEAGYFFDGGVFELPKNFAITEKGIELLFNRYEAAAYAQGEIGFTLSFDKISSAIDLAKIK